ncbi:MAG: hypothetical protein QXV14_08135 [Candidatus Caldarchaeum sp.]
MFEELGFPGASVGGWLVRNCDVVEIDLFSKNSPAVRKTAGLRNRSGVVEEWEEAARHGACINSGDD